jgi:hypothetical protein
MQRWCARRGIAKTMEDAIMRPAVATLAILTTTGLSLAFADPPATPVAPESRSTTAQNSTAEDSTDQNSAAHTVPATAAATAAETPAVAPARSTPSASSARLQEQLLRSQGYKLSMVNGKEEYCRREIPLGSHLPTVFHCLTVAQAEAMAREGRETTERIQRNTPTCLAGSRGPFCGN